MMVSAMPAAAEITPIYFGNGCFWGRQKDFVDTEMKMGRDVMSSTAVVGYAGGQENTKDTCYYYNAPGTLYERQGHAEVVQVSNLCSMPLMSDQLSPYKCYGKLCTSKCCGDRRNPIQHDLAEGEHKKLGPHVPLASFTVHTYFMSCSYLLHADV
jgi:hypothetical protein